GAAALRLRKTWESLCRESGIEGLQWGRSTEAAEDTRWRCGSRCPTSSFNGAAALRLRKTAHPPDRYELTTCVSSRERFGPSVLGRVVGHEVSRPKVFAEKGFRLARGGRVKNSIECPDCQRTSMRVPASPTLPPPAARVESCDKKAYRESGL